MLDQYKNNPDLFCEIVWSDKASTCTTIHVTPLLPQTVVFTV